MGRDLIIGVCVAVWLAVLAYVAWRGVVAWRAAGIRLSGVLAAHTGQHADTAGLGLSSPEPGPGRSMDLATELAELEAWGQAYEIPEIHLHGMASGGGAPPWELAEQWPAHDDPYYLPDPPAAAAPVPPSAAAGPDAAGPGAGVLPPGPAAPTWPEPTRMADTGELFRAPLLSDVLAYERAQTADCWAFSAAGWDDVANYLRNLREALA